MSNIRAAAQAEAEGPQKLSSVLGGYTAGFINGAVWAVEQVTPTREAIADELRKHKLVHVSVSRKSAFCVCNSSLKAGTDANLEWFEAHRADAVLALLGELAEGAGQ